ncbi:vitamin K epoxide reductase family protein [Candidatus Uhrbacteria bacterium]|nr:vitamin K epoxide reductase family protein [Candidatus Uhrbacteria bacterium]
MVFETLFLVLSVLGIADAGYLTYKHTRKQPLICPIGNDCSVVTESTWSHIFGVRNEVLGLLYYIGMGCAMLIVLFASSLDGTIVWLLPLVTGIGVLFSLFLVSLQAFVIKKYCFYCLLSAAISFLLFLVALRLFFPAIS